MTDRHPHERTDDGKIGNPCRYRAAAAKRLAWSRPPAVISRGPPLATVVISLALTVVISLALTVPAAVIMLEDSVATVLPGAVSSGRRAVMIMIGSAAQAYHWLSGLRGRATGVPEMVRWPAGWLGT